MSEKPSGALLNRVESMIGVLMQQKWEEFKPYFHEKLLYKVGAAEPVHGPQACADFLARVYTKLQPADHEVRGMWEIGNVVIVEMDAKYKVIEDGRPVTVPCCDVYRFDGNLIREWRVYPDASNVQLRF
jgi:ketosteroid isomerase-like protein